MHVHRDDVIIAIDQDAARHSLEKLQLSSDVTTIGAGVAANNSIQRTH